MRSRRWSGMTSDRMYALAARILRDNDLAEDALQGALITVWRQLPTLRDPDRFEAWVRACSSTRATPRPGVGARGRRTSASCRSTGRRVRMGSSSIDDRDALDRAFRRLTGRAAGGLRPASPRGPAADRDRRHARHPGRHGPLATPLRDAGRCARPSRPTRRRSPPKDGWHDQRTRLRPTRPSLARAGTRRGARSRRSPPSSRPRRRRRRCGVRSAGSPGGTTR